MFSTQNTATCPSMPEGLSRTPYHYSKGGGRVLCYLSGLETPDPSPDGSRPPVGQGLRFLEYMLCSPGCRQLVVVFHFGVFDCSRRGRLSQVSRLVSPEDWGFGFLLSVYGGLSTSKNQMPQRKQNKNSCKTVVVMLSVFVCRVHRCLSTHLVVLHRIGVLPCDASVLFL